MLLQYGWMRLSGVAGYRGLVSFREEKGKELTGWAHSRTLPAGDVFRARLILALADGMTYEAIKSSLQTTAPTISRWPLFEASFRPGSYGFRPKRSAKQAIYDIRRWVTYGYDQVIDLDLKSYFDTIDHDLLMKLVERRVRDPRVLRLIRRWLKA